jgi:hypothetical protein
LHQGSVGLSFKFSVRSNEYGVGLRGDGRTILSESKAAGDENHQQGDGSFHSAPPAWDKESYTPVPKLIEERKTEDNLRDEEMVER